MKPIILFFLLLVANKEIQSTKIPTSVIDLNEKFLDVKDKDFWFVMVSIIIFCLFFF